MDTPEVKSIWQRGWAIGLALLSLVMPLAAIFRSRQGVEPVVDPTSLGSYGLTVVALILGMVCAAGAFVGLRALAPTWLRWLSGILAGLSLLISAYLIVVLIGTCGLQVLSGMCSP
jgi:hypothetical protein